MALFCNAEEGLSARLCHVADDEEGRLDVLLLQDVEDAVGDDGGGAVVKGEVHPPHALCPGDGKDRPRPLRLEPARKEHHEQHGKEQRRGDKTFLHTKSVPVFRYFIYICRAM